VSWRYDSTMLKVEVENFIVCTSLSELTWIT
jgi:hypothetical protein